MTEYKRTCGGCTACCKGWLTTNVLGEDLSPDKPCRFLACDGCSIHEDRPEDPCRAYSCEWLNNTEIPEWMRPKESNVILTLRAWWPAGGPVQGYIDVNPMGKKIDASVLAWLLEFHSRTSTPMRIKNEEGFNFHGSVEFINLAKEGSKNEQ